MDNGARAFAEASRLGDLVVILAFLARGYLGDDPALDDLRTALDGQ